MSREQNRNYFVALIAAGLLSTFSIHAQWGEGDPPTWRYQVFMDTLANTSDLIGILCGQKNGSE
jgi:hypothetical protein